MDSATEVGAFTKCDELSILMIAAARKDEICMAEMPQIDYRVCPDEFSTEFDGILHYAGDWYRVEKYYKEISEIVDKEIISFLTQSRTSKVTHLNHQKPE